eukprot:4840535-Amphidinium_carterae.1
MTWDDLDGPVICISYRRKSSIGVKNGVASYGRTVTFYQHRDVVGIAISRILSTSGFTLGLRYSTTSNKCGSPPTSLHKARITPRMSVGQCGTVPNVVETADDVLAIGLRCWATDSKNVWKGWWALKARARAVGKGAISFTYIGHETLRHRH